MRMYDLIEKKKHGHALTEKELNFLIKDYVDGKIPDYQIAAFLMAVYFKGMTKEETVIMTKAVANSGEIMDLSTISGFKVDKHSTGGVGDKTTLIVGPIVAACGVKVAKMSGRGLGHTGGTVDKLESIPGFNITLEKEEFFDVVNKTGVCVIGQSGNITPADKKLYALRDVTATVDSIPLIAVSIMSKKLAAGSDGILLDVKVGSGAFMKDLDNARNLAKVMVDIGKGAKKETRALITNMDVPLGYAIGNSLEVMEAIETLKGNGPEDLTKVCIELAAHMLVIAGIGELEECKRMANETLHNKSAFTVFEKMVKGQGGNEEFVKNPNLFERCANEIEVFANKEGYIAKMDTTQCGICACILGAGREEKDESIDYNAGIVLKSKIGDYVKEGDVIGILYTNKSDKIEQAKELLLNAITIETRKPEQEQLIYEYIV
ncbi:MAG: pyrimidine-nucleoside phosphorylase [Lachnospiraceae bacterium]